MSAATESRLDAESLARAAAYAASSRTCTLSVRSGEVVGLLGPNGAGKTTSFYMIVGLIRSTPA